MEKLSDFKPLKRVVLPGLGELNCTGLTVFVGPNSSGKTQLLRDIKGKVAGEARDLVVATELEVEVPELDPFIKCLKAEGYITSFFDDNDQEQYVPRTPFLGMGQAAQNIPSTQATQWHKVAGQPSKRRRKIEFFDWCTPFLVSALFLENRLTAWHSVSNIDFETQPCEPLHDFDLRHQPRPKRGAPLKYDWVAFNREIRRIKKKPRRIT